MLTREENRNSQAVSAIQLTLRDGQNLTFQGWVEENPNGSITVHEANGERKIYQRDEYQEWHTAA